MSVPLTEEEEFEFRLRLEREKEKAAPKQYDPEAIREMSYNMGRKEHPFQSAMADYYEGVTGLMRGGLDQITDGVGSKIWPKIPGEQNEGMKLLGALNDPVALGIGYGGSKLLPYAPVLSKAATAGRAAVKGGGVKALAQNFAGGAATGGAIGALSEDGTAAGGAALGGGLSVALPFVAGSAGKIWDIGKNATGPMREAWQTQTGKDYWKKLLGPKLGMVADALENPSQIIAGSPTTAADRVAGATMGGTDKFGSSIVKAQELLSGQARGGISDEAKTIAAQQEAARAAELAKVAGAPGALESAVANRAAASTRNYQAAFGNKVPVDNELLSMTDNPYFSSAMKDTMALVRAKEQQTGKSLDLTEQLHLLKLSLDKRLSRTGDTALSNTEKREYKQIQDQVVRWLGKNNPDYDAARLAHEAASKPINQMKLGQDLQRSLESPLSGAERPSVFSNAVAAAENKVSQATGRPRADDLLPNQRASIQRVQDELARNAERDALASGVDVNDLMNVAENGKASLDLPNIMSRPASITNWVMGRMGNSADQIIAQDFGKMLLNDPAGFSKKYLRDVPPSQAKIIIEMLKTEYKNSLPAQRGAVLGAAQGDN